MGLEVGIVDGNVTNNFGDNGMHGLVSGGVEDAPIYGVYSIFSSTGSRIDGTGKRWHKFFDLNFRQNEALLMQRMRGLVVGGVPESEFHGGT
jgi:hypothetical protein